MRRTGLMGGTFDPVHYGHLLAAEAAREAAGLEEVWFIPAYLPPHKGNPHADAEARMGMLKAALEGIPEFMALDIELKRQGISYTIDTVRALTEAHPDRSFYWIMGSDMVKHLPRWREPEELARRVTFIGLERPEEPLKEEDIPEFVRGRLIRAPMPMIGISSTDIRRRLQEGRSVRFMMPDAVLEWIRRHGLYGS